MTDHTDRLAQIRARAEAATPGPWEPANIFDYDPHTKRSVPLGTVYAGTKKVARALFVRPNSQFADADFIAQSRHDIPYLLDLVGSLTEDLELADRTCASLTLAQQFTRHDLETVVAERDALRAAVEEAREYLTGDHDLDTRQEVAQAVLTILDRGPKESEES